MRCEKYSFKKVSASGRNFSEKPSESWISARLNLQSLSGTVISIAYYAMASLDAWERFFPQKREKLPFETVAISRKVD